MPFCTNCGHENPDGARFCAQCGSPLTAAGAGDTDPGLVPVGDGAQRSAMGDTTGTLAPVGAEEPDGLSAEDEAALRALPKGSALLIVRRGPNAGSRFLLNTDVVTVGRHQSSDIFLDDISVSRRHATFTRRPDGTEVRDLGSLNGTYVNREIVESAVLRHADEVQIGKFRLVFFASPLDAE